MSRLEQLNRNFRNAVGAPYAGFIVEVTDANSGANVRLYTSAGTLYSDSGTTQTDALGNMNVYVSGGRTYNLALYDPETKALIDTFYETSPGTNHANSPNVVIPGAGTGAGVGAGASVFTVADTAFLSDYAVFGMMNVANYNYLQLLPGYDGFTQPGDSGASSILVRLGVGISYDSSGIASSSGASSLNFDFSFLAARGILFTGLFGTRGTYTLDDGSDYSNESIQANWYGPYHQLALNFDVPKTIQPQGTPRSNHTWEIYATFSKAAVK